MGSQKYPKFDNYMNMSSMFTTEELNMLSDRQFFINKNSITEKLTGLLNELSLKIEFEITSGNYLLPDEVIQSRPKISKGENYLGFPWMVLDYPRVFKQHDTFAFRSLCWWGHEFSFTLQIGGCFLLKYKPLIVEMIQQLQGRDLYICINDSPWNYHFTDDNFLLLDDFMKLEKEPKKWLEKRSFIKISKRSELTNISVVPLEGSDFFRLVASLLLIKNAF